jgi:hypothetical protein
VTETRLSRSVVLISSDLPTITRSGAAPAVTVCVEVAVCAVVVLVLALSGAWAVALADGCADSDELGAGLTGAELPDGELADDEATDVAPFAFEELELSGLPSLAACASATAGIARAAKKMNAFTQLDLNTSMPESDGNERGNNTPAVV